MEAAWKLFLQTEVDAEQIYVYLDSVDGADSEYFCRFFVANPDFDRTVGQIKLTTLWQEKKNLLTGESTVLYRFKDFSPEDLNKGMMAPFLVLTYIEHRYSI